MAVFFLATTLHSLLYCNIYMTQDLWLNQLKSFPPIFFGAGFGVCDQSPHLGYMVKGGDVSAEYLKNLTLEK